MQRDTESHHKITPTAAFVSYFRSFYSKQDAAICRALGARPIALKLLKDHGITVKEALFLSVYLELRTRCIDNEIKRAGIKQVLEMGVGFAPERTDPNVLYVETDLAGAVKQRRELFEQGHKYGIQRTPKNHILEAANALKFRDLKRAARHFSNGEISVVHIGMFPYFKPWERPALADNIHKLLSKHGGVWINPDVLTLPQLEGAARMGKVGELVRLLTGVSDRNIEQNAFKDNAEATKFFEDHGFTVELKPRYDGTFKLDSLSRLKLPDAFAKALGQTPMWILRVKNSGRK